jgi:hypothetical protein
MVHFLVGSFLFPDTRISEAHYVRRATQKVQTYNAAKNDTQHVSYEAVLLMRGLSSDDKDPHGDTVGDSDENKKKSNRPDDDAKSIGWSHK